MVRLSREDNANPDFYYSAIPYRPEEMTSEELLYEIENMENRFKRCAEIGQGISTKETVRHNKCKSAYIKLIFGDMAEERLSSFFGIS